MTSISIPVQITAGLSFSASVKAADHPASAWVITLHLRGPMSIDLQAEPDGKFSALAAETRSWAPGKYWWSIRAANGDDVVEIERGDLVVRPDMLAAPNGTDTRTDNERALDAIEAVMGKRASLDQERYRINNRELYRTPIADLIKLRSFYAAAVAREKRKASGRTGWGRPVHVRFS